eukprot:TRINITY_DN7463_c0_g1_i3.p1 TRINITY_DN7463_c0_g1~~TRINITY_DN7463_c0_g1_i3.p1  ORF type:complete len:371 (+),score=66.99 TRINITY_DN7463_c0_g1_i3:64-1176(+)
MLCFSLMVFFWVCVFFFNIFFLFLFFFFFFFQAEDGIRDVERSRGLGDVYKRQVSTQSTWEVVEYEDNIFKGWTEDELKSLLGDLDRETLVQGELPESRPVPSSIDWTDSKCYHAVRNQGNCGSCWAFATTGVVSDHCCLSDKDYGWLAPQELVSCDRAINSGCNGGLASDALKYVQENGLVPEACFTYMAKDTACPKTCNDQSDWKSAHVCKCKTLVDCGTLEGMKQCLLKGPIAVRMLMHMDFFHYKSGVYCWDNKSDYIGGHAIRAVGYGEDPEPFFRCANSWSPVWGENGHFKISPKADCGLRTTEHDAWYCNCLLYTSDAADDTPCVDLGGRRIIKKKKKKNNNQPSTSQTNKSGHTSVNHQQYS